MDLKERIEAMVKRADEVTAAHWKRSNYTHSAAPRHQAEYNSDKWARIVTLEERGGKWERGSVYCFVCLKDGFTKALGTLKAGDIHKAATFKAPAKHARGSVFQEDFNNCLNEYGVAYLKGYG
jgi:hypothetical protein